MDDLTFELQLKKEFLEEAAEILEQFESGLLKLESAAHSEALLNKLFRDAHTLKGSGLAAGFEGLGRFAHKVENVLDQLRSGLCLPNREVIQALLAGCDGLKSWVQVLSKDFHGIHNGKEAEEHLLQCIEASKLSKKQGLPPKEADIEIEEIFSPQLLTPIVYVCDDEHDLRDLIIDLYPSTWKVEGFDNGQSLLARVKVQKPHLIVSDLKMPGMSGQQMVEAIRADGQATPVIFISGQAGRDHVIGFLKLGAIDFFEKPFVMQDLLNASRRALQKLVHEQALMDLSTLAFRTYLRFTRIEDLVDIDSLSSEKRAKLLQLERAMTRIGQLSISAFKFGNEFE